MAKNIGYSIGIFVYSCDGCTYCDWCYFTEGHKKHHRTFAIVGEQK